jgi:hypothetical protein
MSDSHSNHEASHGAAANPFTDTEIAHFQKEDRYAGGAVVALMTCIFSIGIVLYTIVLVCVL